jgi:class 3 adenylate cyclase/tetratricopeptide (TPR) repeat protein
MSCLQCGFESPAGFRFCGACGASLATIERRASDHERKIISALFCDVVGSTVRAEPLDPEDVRDALAPYYEGVRRQLGRFDGTVEKFIGDAVCGLFGAPRSHGDDSERAVRAALAIRDWIAEVNEADPNWGIHVRLGIATGEAVVALGARLAEGEAMAWGDVMNTAARLQTAADVDSVLVDERTYRATRHVIDYAEREPVEAKGKSQPILVWRAQAPRARRGIDLAQEDSQTFVGRAREFRLLRESLNRVGRRHAPELVVLVGEAGIGKSRLAFELFRWVEVNPALVGWRQASSSPYADVFTYWALGEIVRAQAGILETDSAAIAGGKLKRAVADVVAEPADAARIESHLRSLVGLDAPALAHGGERQAAFVAWRQFLEAVAQRHTLVLVFEDLQWADAGILDFVEHLLDWARDVRILILCTARPEFAELRPGWWSGERVTPVDLTPLSDEEVGELVSKTAPPDIPGETREAIIGAASGNPLFAVEFVRMLVDRMEEPPTVESVQAIIAARLDTLSPEDKLLLQDAAVVGRAVWPRLLARLGDRSRRTVEQQLRELLRRGFLTRVTQSSVQGEPEYRFRHTLVRDEAYRQIPRLRKVEIHRRTAEWLDSLSPDRTTERAEMLALHYLAAYENALAAGADTGSLVEGARVSLREAGDRALSLNAFAVAERHFRDAADLWPEDDPEWPALLLRLGKARYYSASEGDDVLSDAEHLLLAAEDRESAAEAAMLLADLAHQHGEPQETVFDIAYRAHALVEGLEPSHVKTDVLLDLAVFLSLAADQERAIALATEALRDAQALALREPEARALAVIGAARGQAGDPDGRRDLERSIAITEEIESPGGAHHCGMLADLECSLGNLDRSFELHARARAHAERYGHAGHIQWLKAESVAEHYWTGRWSQAVVVADEFLAEVGEGPGHFMEGYCRDVRARIRLARGDIDGALDDSAQALEQARASNEPQMLCPALAVRARALAAAGVHENAGQVVDELLALWISKMNLFPVSSWVVDLVCALDDLGRADELRVTAAHVRARTAWLEAAVALTAGEFEDAASRFARIGSRPDEALARRRAAGALIRAGTTREAARVELERALAFYRDVEAAAELREAEALVA